LVKGGILVIEQAGIGKHPDDQPHDGQKHANGNVADQRAEKRGQFFSEDASHSVWQMANEQWSMMG